MKKLNLNALKERANSVTSEELMNSINGGIENGCHSDDFFPEETKNRQL